MSAQDADFQPAFCRWAANALGIDDAVSVEFVHEEAKEWSEWTFEDASCNAVVTRANGETVTRYVEFDQDLMTSLLAAQREVTHEAP